jgi:hypothetical protein
VKARIPPDIKGNGKNQDQAGDKDDLKEQGSMSKDETHGLPQTTLNRFSKIPEQLGKGRK